MAIRLFAAGGSGGGGGVAEFNPATPNAVVTVNSATAANTTDLLYSSDTLTLAAQTAQSGTSLTVAAGNYNGSNSTLFPGDLNLNGGSSTGSNSSRGGDVNISGGSGYGDGSNGDVNITGGTALFGFGGNVNIQAGGGTSPGKVFIGGTAGGGGTQIEVDSTSLGFFISGVFKFGFNSGLLELNTNMIDGMGNTEWLGYDQTYALNPFKGIAVGTGGVYAGVVSGALSQYSASALGQFVSTTQGFAPPAMTTTQKNAISAPIGGLIVFDTTLAKLCVYSGAAWQTITSV